MSNNKEKSCDTQLAQKYAQIAEEKLPEVTAARKRRVENVAKTNVDEILQKVEEASSSGRRECVSTKGLSVYQNKQEYSCLATDELKAISDNLTSKGFKVDIETYTSYQDYLRGTRTTAIKVKW